MRIIAGEFRGRVLLPPQSDTTRPVTDRAKQSLFDVLAEQIPGAVVYDCFAGTGSMGLECLSRGATHATFFERDRDALQRLKQNIDNLAVAGRSTVIAGDLFKWPAEQRQPASPVNLVFMDPPYRFLTEKRDALHKLIQQIGANNLAADGTLIFRHDHADELELEHLQRYDQRRYGAMAIELYRRRHE